MIQKGPRQPTEPYVRFSHHEWSDGGLLREGMAADVCVFDPKQIADRSTYDAGRQLAVGMAHVIVNGQLVLHEGKRTSALPGRALRSGH